MGVEVIPEVEATGTQTPTAIPVVMDMEAHPMGTAVHRMAVAEGLEVETRCLILALV